MSEDQVVVPANHPLVIAWERYKETPDFANTVYWGRFEEHLKASLWASFVEGFKAGLDVLETKPPPKEKVD